MLTACGHIDWHSTYVQCGPRSPSCRQPALHAYHYVQVAWPIRVGLLVTAPGFGLTVSAAGQCMTLSMATIDRFDTSIGPRLAQDWPWPQPLSLRVTSTSSIKLRVCISLVYMASVPALALSSSSPGSALGSSPLNSASSSSSLGSTLSLTQCNIFNQAGHAGAGAAA